MLKVTVLIVNWNGCRLLGPCLEALKRQTHPVHEVIVVDNGSHDESVGFLKNYDWPPLKTLFLRENTGFSGGNNAGFPMVGGDILALLNNDAVVDPDWIAAALPLFENTATGMVACKTLRFSDPRFIDKAGHLIYPDGLNRGRGTGQRDGEPFNRVEEALWPDGSAGFYRKSMLDEIGFFDDDFFLYGEDAELGMRARWAGYRCVYQPRSRVLHHHSSSLGKSSPLKIYYVERNRIWLLVKTFPLGAILVSPWHSFRRYLMNVASLLLRKGAASGFSRNRSPLVLAIKLLQALWDGCLGIPGMVAKRRHIVRRISAASMRALLKQYRISAREITLID